MSKQIEQIIKNLQKDIMQGKFSEEEIKNIEDILNYIKVDRSRNKC